MSKCLVCGDSATVSNPIGFFAKLVCCSSCGKYMVENDVLINDDIPLKTKACILYYLNNRDKQTLLTPHFHDNLNWEDGLVEKTNRYTVSVKSLINLFPTNLSTQIDMMLLNIYSMIKYVGNSFCIEHGSENSLKYLYPHFFINPDFGDQSLFTQFSEFHDILIDEEYIRKCKSKGDSISYYTLTSKGWNRVAELQKSKIISSKAFIAMWFADEMQAARLSINDAITNCGYIPIIIDAKEHNDQIVPEIFHEIKESTFVVADITGHRTGVYYEAGYAQALDKEVILTCRSDDFNNRHFDIAQKNTIVWNNEQELYCKLMKRIEVTVGKRN